MSQHFPWIKFTIFIFLSFRARSALGRTSYIFMTNHCSMVVKVDDSLVLALTYQEKLPGDRDRDFTHCDLDLVAPEGKKLFVHFLQLAISPSVDHSDRLQLFDPASNNTRLTPVKGLYGKLDRTLSMFDDSGTQINDYRSISNQMRFDYLGKPTVKSPGYRLLVTTFQEPSYGGRCPDSHYLCRKSWICIPIHVVCDGMSNCGKSDDGDEKGCDRYDTVTNLLAKYSLVRDIMVAILLPLVVFIAFVVSTFLLAHRYIRLKVNKPEPPVVHFTPKRDGQVRIGTECDVHAPPSYEDTLSRRYEPPPAYPDQGISYSRIEYCSDAHDFEKEPELSVSESRCKIEGLQPQVNQTIDSVSSKDIKNDSTKRGLDKAEYENYILHCVWPSDTDDDDELKEKRRRKGGRGKVKGSRKESSKLNEESDTLNSSSIPRDLSFVKCSNTNLHLSDAAVVVVSSSADVHSPDITSLDVNLNCDSRSSAASPQQTGVIKHDPRRSQRFVADPKNPSYSSMPSTAEITEPFPKFEKSFCSESTDFKTDPTSPTSERLQSENEVKQNGALYTNFKVEDNISYKNDPTAVNGYERYNSYIQEIQTNSTKKAINEVDVSTNSESAALEQNKITALDLSRNMRTSMELLFVQ